MTHALLRHPRLIALAAGAASATGFAPLGLWPVAVAALALWTALLLQEPRAWRTMQLGWCFGLGQFAVGLNWIAKAFTYQDAMPVWLGWVAVLLLALYLAVFPGLAALGARLIAGRTPLRLVFILALTGSWIVSEWVRSWAFTGFIWNPLASLMASDGLLLWAQSARVLGTYGLALFPLLAAGLILLLLARQWRAAVLIGLLLTAGPLITLATHQGPNCGPPLAKDCASHQVTVVQPNIGQHQKAAPGYEARNLAMLAAQTRPLPGQTAPRMIFWPEAAILDYLEDGYPQRYYYGRPPGFVKAQLTSLMNPGDMLILGALALEFADTPGGDPENRRLVGARNSIMAMTSEGRLLRRYDKAHLVPWGEYLPLRAWTEAIGLVALGATSVDFWTGPGPRSIDLGSFGKMGGAVCYEIIFPGQIIDRSNRPDFLFNPSIDSWYGPWGPPQHLAMARLRAIEEGLPVIRSTPTGISAVIDADGIVRASLPLGQAGRIDMRLPPAHAPTLFALLGNSIALGLAIILLISAIAMRRYAR
jgi:apolipoprotein N-acyltransferase